MIYVLNLQVYTDFVMVVSTHSLMVSTLGSSVSTQPLVVSTLVPDYRRPSCLTGTVCRHNQWQCRH
ncbi:hypothetical protein Taro_002488 [Colocasia esculenta]|uniref:Uncharacterized protein n=1 Tax=Colocasia esculenta TaxID=4460 RepID=A0A843TKX8_COLES|nr:hypothetical protein [Colocasia esculenta]